MHISFEGIVPFKWTGEWNSFTAKTYRTITTINRQWKSVVNVSIVESIDSTVIFMVNYLAAGACNLHTWLRTECQSDSCVRARTEALQITICICFRSTVLSTARCMYAVHTQFPFVPWKILIIFKCIKINHETSKCVWEKWREISKKKKSTKNVIDNHTTICLEHGMTLTGTTELYIVIICMYDGWHSDSIIIYTIER